MLRVLPEHKPNAMDKEVVTCCEWEFLASANILDAGYGRATSFIEYEARNICADGVTHALSGFPLWSAECVGLEMLLSIVETIFLPCVLYARL